MSAQLGQCKALGEAKLWHPPQPWPDPPALQDACNDYPRSQLVVDYRECQHAAMTSLGLSLYWIKEHVIITELRIRREFSGPLHKGRIVRCDSAKGDRMDCRHKVDRRLGLNEVERYKVS